MYIIIIGCGRLGSNLAKQLADEGHDICIIDRDSDKLNVLGSGFNGKRIKGIEFDSDKLAEAGINQADSLLAVTSDDNINITVSLISEKIYHVPNVIARVNVPEKKYIYDTLEIKTINTIDLGINILKRMLDVDNLNVISEIDNDYEIIDFLISKERPVTVEYIENHYSCIISGVIKDSVTILPKKDYLVHNGDRIICTLQKNQDRKLFNSFTKGMLI